MVEIFGKRNTKAGDPAEAVAHVAKMFRVSRTERHDFEYDAVKLERVVKAAMMRAREEGKEDLADSVHLLYLDSLENMDLRVLLEKTLTQRVTVEETKDFQDYVRSAKRRLKHEKAKKNGNSLTNRDIGHASLRSTESRPLRVSDLDTPPSNKAQPASPVSPKARSSTRTQTPRVTITKTVETMAVQTKDASQKSGVDPSCNKPARLDSHHATEDSGYGSEQTGDKASTEDGNESSKRKSASITSSQEAEQEDLEEARRASKRRRRAGSDDSGSYHPSMDNSRRAKSRTKKSKTANDERTSGSSSPLSEPDDVDIEEAKEAYVDEMVRRRSAEASRQAIEDTYGPVSPSLVGDIQSEPAESWASMPSPTMEPARTARPAPPPPPPPSRSREEEQATAGAENSETQANGPTSKEVAAPAPEGFTPDEGANAYKLITSTIGEAIVPYFKHMEAKLDKLESQQKATTKDGQALPSTEELMKVVKSLESGTLQSNKPETMQLMSQLLKNAAEASIHAAEAARKAGEVARDVSQVLAHLSASNNDSETTPKASQRGQRKKN